MHKLARSEFEAVIFDLDGVITQSAKVHAQAWKKLFDPFLSKQGESGFDIQQDYYAYVDGKPRLEGIRSFLQSRGIQLDEGSPDDSEEQETIHGLAKRKNKLFLKYLNEKGIDAYQTSVELVKMLKTEGFKVAIISSSKNCKAILEKVGILDLFEAQVDGVKSQRLQLKGKPAPDIFLQAAKELGVLPKKVVVVEDSLAGVQAGKEGGFGLVIGVNRADQAEALAKKGANVVVSDLKEIKVFHENT